MNFVKQSTAAAAATLALVLSAVFLGCSPNQPTSPIGLHETKRLVPAANSITVFDPAGAPIVGATVLIGLRHGTPFADNVLKTDASGSVVLPAAWTSAEPVTVEAAGFVKATWMAQTPAAMALSLRKAPPAQKLELTGETTGFKNLSKDGWVDVGIVFPALRFNQLASLQITDLISPEVDSMSVAFTDVDIPSNVSIPAQDERYFFTLTLEKPVYRSYPGGSGTWKMVAAHARFPFEKVVDDLRAGKSIYDVINYFEFKGASVSDIPMIAPSTWKNLSVATTVFDGKLDVTAPNFASQYRMLAIPVTQTAGYLYPTDVKVFGPRETRRMVMPKGTLGYTVGALRDANAPKTGAGVEALSVVIAPSGATSRFEFLDIPRQPSMRGSTLRLEPPTASIAAIAPAATFASLSSVSVKTAGKMQLETKTPLWDVYASGWAGAFELPDAPARAKASYRWDVTFGGAANGKSVRLGPDIVEDLSHLTKSAVDL